MKVEILYGDNPRRTTVFRERMKVLLFRFTMFIYYSVLELDSPPTLSADKVLETRLPGRKLMNEKRKRGVPDVLVVFI